MKFEFYDTLDKARIVTADMSADEMRCLLSVFKTHCKIEGSAYQFNHFVNWVKKYHGFVIKSDVNEKPVRIDM